jgi:UDP-N-acetylglucosamine 2-epimerase (non-hydrolysing)
MKVAPILAALRARGHQAVLVHTGQHYDPSMSDRFFADLGMAVPDHHLEVGSGTHAQQTARVMERFEPVLVAERPAWVVVVGDVNSTLACALVASKLRHELGCRIAHVEAGLRSHDWRMPEEVNRVLTDRLSDLLLLPSRDALPNLVAEGIDAARTVMVGNVMIDTLLRQLEPARAVGAPKARGVRSGGYALVTLHRPSNVDDPATLGRILGALQQIANHMPVVLPLHPRTRRNLASAGLENRITGLKVEEPVGYLEMLSLTDGAAVVLTDSGGLQEETTVLGVPCVTLREQTERPVTVTEGTNRMAPWPLTTEGILSSYEKALKQGRVAVGSRCPEGWDGKASERVVEALEAR